MALLNKIKLFFWPGPDFGTRDRFELRELLQKGPEVETLDVGFGNGCMTFASADMGKRAIGVSILQHEVDKAMALRSEFGLADDRRCLFKKIHFNKLREEGLGPFDQIIMFEVLEHIIDDQLAIKSAVELLKPRGQLHISVPNIDHHSHFEPLNRFENGGHVRHGYSFERLQKLLLDHGLEILDRRGIGGLGSIVGFKVVAVARRAPGVLGQMLSLFSFLLLWPLVKILNLIFPKPWSLYILACKK